jgi:hypothetical protein
MIMRRSLMTLLACVAIVPVLVTAQGARPRPAAPEKIEVPTPELPRDSSGNIIFNREVYSYPRAGRRDPFASLITTGDIRPILADLEIVGIILDGTGRNSVATLRDVSTSEIYRVRVGSTFGRMRVTAIRQREVGLAIDEFGFTRQEVLSITVPSRGGRTP